MPTIRCCSLLCLALTVHACSAYDAQKIEPSEAMAGAPGTDSGSVGSAGTQPPTPPPVGVDGGDPGRPDAAPGDGGEPPGRDAAAGCVPNTDPDQALCPELCPELCNALDDDCDGEVDGPEAEAACAAPHALTTCQRGACLVLECQDGHRDCDDQPETGCEIAPTDPRNCGGCGRVCELSQASATCDDGTCVVAACAAGYADCDGDRLSCERSTRTLTDCGGCGVPCGALADATPSCAGGTCEIEACTGLHGDCDGQPGNGCETTLDSLVHCSACDSPCAKASCAGGVCTAVSCTPPFADCDRDELACEVDTAQDVLHCGGCDLPCAFSAGSPHATLACSGGSCEAACDADYGDCDGAYATGCETPLLTSAAHCGGCGDDCAALLPHVASASCSNATCGVTTCDSGWENCDGDPSNGCERDVAALGPCHPDTGCTKVLYGGHEYHFCPTLRSRDDARTRCRLQTRGDLVHVDDAAENAFVDANRVGASWIGGSDGTREGTFRWLDDGVPFWKSGSSVLGRYANFAANQPDDYNAGEDCLELGSGGSWNDLACAQTRAFVCEVRPDDCPSDAAKIAPGQCGCGMAETDGDADAFADCAESCDADVNKQSAGACGCGVADTDGDGDGSPNCNDGCDADPTQTAACLGFTPVGFDPNTIDWSATPVATLNCGTTTVSTTDPDGTGPLIATLTNWCGTAPTLSTQTQSGGPELVILALRGLTVAASNSLRLIGDRPVVIAVDGDVGIAGAVDANASGTTGGAGAHFGCGTSAGGNGSGDTARFGGASGGGGGGFGTAGGRAGTADTDGSSSAGGSAGVARGNTNLSPLFGGCAGGRAGDCSTAGGGGGGAVQITASGTLTLTGTLRANGAAGATPCGASDEGGGTGGGSGGALLLEALTLSTGGGTLQVNGAAGGANGSYAGIYNCGGMAGGGGSTSSSAAGGNGGNCQGGSPGGGGGYGRLRTVDH